MKTIEFTYGAKTLHLYLNGGAMFAVDALDADRPEGERGVLDIMAENTPDGFQALCQVAHILAEQGELCRRYLQHTPNRIPPVEELERCLSPMQLLNLRTAVIRAVNAGYGQPDGETGGDIDLGLAELEKKTKL
jgi:hypothetical protein